jgi:uncharacterized protein YecE (DUF72 family)
MTGQLAVVRNCTGFGEFADVTMGSTQGHPVYIGTAGWAIPRVSKGDFPAEGTTLERYSSRLNATEINSSFHRSHRPSVYERWAASVPPSFRFAVKLPKTITHQNRLVDCEALLRAFAEEIGPLESRRGPILVQLPPSLMFDQTTAEIFFGALSGIVGGPVACEPRHPSWFQAEVDAFLTEQGIARVAADPARTPEAARPGGSPGLVYYRLHGSPRTYWSSYDPDRLASWAQEVVAQSRGAECWIIFDNTAGGAAAGNALELARMIASAIADKTRS